MELCFPNYDGNGMYLSMGNLLENPQVGLLFIDFANPMRARVSGRASIDPDDPLTRDVPGSTVRRAGRRRRGVPELPALHPSDDRSRRRRAFVPAADGSAPVPDWKRSDWACDVLPADDPARG